ncbi:MAG TPA: metallophosphoesterase [Terriglobia bacterium]|nr:metallophosphoesterase [Terriglobia bacterium]
MIHHKIPNFALLRLGIMLALLTFFIASQVYWFRRVGGILRRFAQTRMIRRLFGSALLALYFFLLWNYLWHRGGGSASTVLTLKAALVDAPFGCWLFGSLTGFLIVLVLYLIPSRLFRSASWLARKTVASLQKQNAPPTKAAENPTASPEIMAGVPAIPSRRQFLERAALTLGVAPFVAGGYGLLRGRLNLQITETSVKMDRLPREFDGFRILQLSDLHIGPFMTASEIRSYVAIANRLHADLMALTGDFVTWDPSTQYAVVDALTGLKAPYGVTGCLGNHEIYTHTEDSITQLFAARGVKILRHEAMPVQSHGESINLIGVDFQTNRSFGHRGKAFVRHYLQGVETLLRPDTANILLSHNPNTFDRAAALGIGLSLAGHTHGGQVTLEFISKDINPARLITPYVRGWFEKPGGKLYVNCGIGTIGLPIRFDAPPEITVYKLTKSA